MTDSEDTQVVAFPRTPPHWRGSPVRYLNTPFTQLETSIEINEKLRKTNQS